MTKKSLLVILLLYIASTLGTYGGYTLMAKNQANSNTANQQTGDQVADEGSSAAGKLLQVSPSEPKDQPCPLNGRMFTNTEKNAWEKRRPLAVMIENTPDARPQSGLSSADVVFEAMAEGGITRFSAYFYCNAQAQDITLAPIRSARQYYWEIASGFNNPLYVHVGGANSAGPADVLSHISDAGWAGQNDMNQFSVGYPTFVRDYNRLPGKVIATEHTMVTSTEKLWDYAAKKRGWTNMSPDRVVAGKKVAGSDWKAGFTPWLFQDGEASSSPTAPQISFAFWDGFDEYAVKWDYDKASNSYKRSEGGEAHTDLNNSQQLTVKNAVVLFADEKGPIDAEKHMLYGLSGATGPALIFQNGTTVKATWSKKDRESNFVFTDEKGKAVKFVRGPIWISVVGKKTTIKY